MKTIIIAIKHLLVPLMFVFFLMLGLIAAALSGIIEYFVLKEFFRIPETAKFSFYIPFIIVMVLEGFKVFLHFSIPIHKGISTNKMINVYFCTACKWALVIFSFICTIVYTANSLYSPSIKDNSYVQISQEITRKYEAEREKAENQNAQKIDTLIEIERSKWQAAEEKLNNLTPVYSSNSRYEKYVKERKELEQNVKQAKLAFDAAVEKIYADASIELNSTLTAIAEKEVTEKENAKKTIIEDTIGDNSYLSSALRFFTSTFAGNANGYNRTTYYMCVLAIAFIVAAILESVISVAQSYISANEDELQRMFETNLTIDETLKRKFNSIIKLFILSGLMLSIFIICGLLSELSLDKGSIISAAVSYASAIVMTTGKFKFEFKTEVDNSSALIPQKAYDFLVTTKQKTVPGIIQTLLCIMVFVLIGIFSGNDVSNMLPSTIALSIGSMGGQLLLTNKITTA